MHYHSPGVSDSASERLYEPSLPTGDTSLVSTATKELKEIDVLCYRLCYAFSTRPRFVVTPADALSVPLLLINQIYHRSLWTHGCNKTHKCPAWMNFRPLFVIWQILASWGWGHSEILILTTLPQVLAFPEISKPSSTPVTKDKPQTLIWWRPTVMWDAHNARQQSFNYETSGLFGYLHHPKLKTNLWDTRWWAGFEGRVMIKTLTLVPRLVKPVSLIWNGRGPTSHL